MKNYIAAGFDPARFWDLTPRLYVTEMEGAEQRAKVRRSEIWFTAMLPQLKQVPSHQEFVGGRDPKADKAACIAAWDRLDRVLDHTQRRKQAAIAAMNAREGIV